MLAIAALNFPNLMLIFFLLKHPIIFTSSLKTFEKSSKAFQPKENVVIISRTVKKRWHFF